LARRVATKYDDIAVGCGCDRSRGFEPLALYSAASRAHSLCIRLKTFSEIWRDRSSATDSHIEGGDAEVAAFLVHVRADLDHEIGAFCRARFRPCSRRQHPPISLQLFEAMRYAAQESLTATPPALMQWKQHGIANS
jgi:hypothetical protein